MQIKSFILNNFFFYLKKKIIFITNYKLINIFIKNILMNKSFRFKKHWS